MGCPWASFEDPLVIDVMDCFIASAIQGQGVHIAPVRLWNPPHVIWEGLKFYSRIWARLEQARKEEEEKKRNRKSAAHKYQLKGT